jgi:ATP-dependent Lon protease
LELPEDVLLRAIEEYTREAGVRNFEREIASLVRKSARRIAEGETVTAIAADEVEGMLGPPPFTTQRLETITRPGVAVGMMWTPVGGEIVFVEAALLAGKPGLKLTGQLGEVMRESAEAALSYLRANAERLAIDPELFEKNEIHVHVPSGAMKKDGPSAGLTILVTLASLLSGRPVADDLAMTGEITLRGQVLPVGGVKEKILAAHRAGVRRLLLPSRSEKDLWEVPAEVLDSIEFRFADTADDALGEAIPDSV